MSVAHRRPDVAVAKQLADHRPAFAERQGARRRAVSQVMELDVAEPGFGPDDVPGGINAAAAGIRLAARKHLEDCPHGAAGLPAAALVRGA